MTRLAIAMLLCACLASAPASAQAASGHLAVGTWSSGGVDLTFSADGSGRFVDIAFAWEPLGPMAVLVTGPIAKDTLQARFAIELDEQSRPTGRFDVPLLGMLRFIRVAPEGIMVKTPALTAPAAPRPAPG